MLYVDNDTIEKYKLKILQDRNNPNYRFYSHPTNPRDAAIQFCKFLNELDQDEDILE